MRLKNRIIWGISFSSLSNNQKQPYINFGESRYAYISWNDLCETLLPTAKVKKGSNTISLKDAIKNKIDSEFIANFDCETFIKNYFFSFMSINKEVIVFKDFSYRIEDDIWVKHCDGKMQYFIVKHFKNHKIQFNRNGTNGYSIWKNNICLEDHIWSISKCKNIIEEMK